ncbi:uncharacterized protein LOC144508431 [Mustelus asterias]
MAAASHSLGGGRPAPVPVARIAPANRYTGFKDQIQQVLGWKKGIKQQTSAAESRSEQGTHFVLGKGAGSEQGTHLVLGKGNGLEQGTHSVLGKGIGSEQGTHSVLGKGAGSEQSIQPSLDKVPTSDMNSQPVAIGDSKLEQKVQAISWNSELEPTNHQTVDSGSEQVTPGFDWSNRSKQGTQSVLGEGAVLQQGTQSVLGEGAGLDQGAQPFVSCNLGSERMIQFVVGNPITEKYILLKCMGEGGGSEQGVQPVLSEGKRSEQGVQPVLSEGKRSEQGVQLVLSEGKRSEQGVQPVLSEGKRSEQGVQLVLSEGRGSKQGVQPVLSEGRGFEQGVQPVLGEGRGSEPGVQPVLSEGRGSEQGSVLSEGRGSEQGVQPVLSEGRGFEQGVQSILGEGKGSEPGVQPVLGEGRGSKQGSVLSEGRGSEQGIQPVLSEGRGFEQGVQSILGEGKGSEPGVQAVLGEGRGSEQGVQPVLSEGREFEQGVRMNLGSNPRIPNVDVKLGSDEKPQATTDSQYTQSTVDRGAQSKQRTKPVVLRNVRPTQHIQSFLSWEKRSEHCIHLPLDVNRISKQRKQPLKCHGMVGLEPWVQPAPNENAGLERQIFISLTRNLSYISGLYDSVRLADGFGPPEQHSSPDGSHLGPGKKDLPPQPIVRKRAKSCPGSPTERRVRNNSIKSNRVRFADSLGLELTEVRSFNSTDEPNVPDYVFNSLINREPIARLIWVQSFKREFTNPKEGVNFDERVIRQKVCLEAVTDTELVLSGTILVLNLAYHKEVIVRYTCSDWDVFTDVPALFESSIEGKTDRFTFTLNLSVHVLKPGSCVQFAIKYTVNGIDFWDNNDSNNYRMTYQPFQITVPISDDSLVNSN